MREVLAEISREFLPGSFGRIKACRNYGTNGKTTTSYLLESIYRHAGIQACLVGTIGMRIGSGAFTVPTQLGILRPDEIPTAGGLEGCTHGALEVSSHSLFSSAYSDALQGRRFL